MEHSEMKNIWVELNGILTPKDNDELKEILKKKANMTSRKFYIATIVSILLSAGVLAFLIVAIISHFSDIYYVINNLLLGLLLIVYLVYYFVIFRRLSYAQNAKFTLYESIERSFNTLSNLMTTRIEIILAPFLGLFLLISIHGFYSSSDLQEILHEEETLWGMVFGIGLAAAAGILVFRKIRTWFKKQLRILRYYRDHIEMIG